MKAILALCVIAAAMYTVVDAACPKSCEDICNQNVDKVCGVDGTWYDNACKMQCNGVIQFSGQEPDCPCRTGRDNLQICGVDGKRYPNEDYMKCYGIAVSNNDNNCPPKSGGIFL